MSLKRIGRWYTVVAVNLLTLVLLLTALNLVPWLGLELRPWIDGKVGETSPFLARYGDEVVKAFPGKSMDEIRALARETWSRPFAYDPVAQFKEAPHEGRYVNVDPQGFRLDGAAQPWPATGGRSVFVFGGSTTFGYGVADAETLPAALERRLAERGEAVTVYNFGRGFYDSNHELMLFVQLLWRGHVPDAAVFVDGTNEFRTMGETALLQTAVLEQHFDRAKSTDGWQPLMAAIRRSPLARLVDWLEARFVGKTPGGGRQAGSLQAGPEDRARAEAVLDRYAANMRMARALAEAYGVEIVFAWQPIPTYAYDIANHPFGISGDMLDPAQMHGYGLLDGARTGWRTDWRGEEIVWCAAAGEGRDELLYVDAVHYSPAMNALVADCIAERLAVPG